MEIKILINSLSISDLHETVTSIINQVGLSRLNANIIMENPHNLDISSELQRISNSDIKLVNEPIDARFSISLNSGEIISRSFLYKAKYYLENNSAAFVCPEYTFRRIDNTLIIATTQNHQMLFNHTSAYLIDNNKLIDHQIASPRATIIKDTCSASKTIDISFPKYLKTLKSSSSFFDSPLFAPKNVISSARPSLFDNSSRLQSLRCRLINSIKPFAGRSKILKKLFKKPTDDKTTTLLHAQTAPYISNQIRADLEQLSNIQYGLKGYTSMCFKDITYEKFLQSEHLFGAYQKVAKNINYDSYSYIMILPWLISGGIDLFAINYLREIAELNPDSNILVFLTNGFHQSFSQESLNLPSNITIVNLPEIFNTKKEYLDFYPQLLYSFINTFTPKRLHIIASKSGYDCLKKYGNSIRQRGTKVLFSSYNYLIGPHGEYEGYTVKELPSVYRQNDIITTDNTISKKLWVEHYGFNANNILVHHQLFEISPDNLPSPSKKDGLNILWAAHIRPEKNPDILPGIAANLAKEKINIDCYGLFSPLSWPDGNNPLITNVPNLHYKGPYSNFFKDINLKKYDLFLYTSHADGTPNIIIEAALAGLPIVASKIGGIPETLKDDAILVENSHSIEQFTNAIRQSLSNQTVALQKAHRSQQRLSLKHNKTNFTKQVQEMLERSK